MTFLAVFSGLLFETIPFLAIGSLLASIVHEWVPERYIAKAFSGSGFRPILAAAAAGFVLPICECAIVPLARRLRRGDVSFPATAAFLLAAPIVNPLTIASTYVAFKGLPHSLVALRLGTVVHPRMHPWITGAGFLFIVLGAGEILRELERLKRGSPRESKRDEASFFYTYSLQPHPRPALRADRCVQGPGKVFLGAAPVRSLPPAAARGSERASPAR